MLKLHEMLSAGEYPNTEKLARQFEVSSRALRRDIDHMRDHHKLPIEYDFVRQGYYYTRPVSHFPGSSSVDPNDVLGLIIAQKVLAQYDSAPFAAELKQARRRLIKQLSPEGRITVEGLDHAVEFLAVGVEELPTASMQAVLNAFRQNRVLTFDHRKAGDRNSLSRRLHPYHVFYNKGRWYVVGYAPDRSDIRTFAIGRMRNVALSIEKIKGAAKFDFRKHFSKSFGVMAGVDDWEVVVDFDAWATDIMRGRKWHSSQQITELPDGCSRMRLLVGNLEEVLEWVLQWGTHAHVVRPETLRRRLSEIGEYYTSRYAEPPESARAFGPHPEFAVLTRFLPGLELWQRRN
jgi:predicted DNA-binding transcriptional regulator YafY